MKIYTSKITSDEKVIHENMGIRSWKWELSLFESKYDLFYLIDKTHYWRSDRDHKWNPFHQEGFSVAIGGDFQFGSDHVYYDGNHCSLHLGWLHFYWSSYPCSKCEETC